MTKKQKEMFKNVKIEYGNDEYRRDLAMNTLARNIARMMIDDGFCASRQSFGRPSGKRQSKIQETGHPE